MSKPSKKGVNLKVESQADKDRRDALRYRKLRDGEEEVPDALFAALIDGGEFLDDVVDSMPNPE